MIQKGVLDDALYIIELTLDALLVGMPLKGREGFDLRHMVGELRANAHFQIRAGTIGSDLLACFDQAYLAGATLAQMDKVRETLLPELPLSNLGKSLKGSGIIFTLVEQCKLITAMTFVSRDDANRMLSKMAAIIETIKLEVSELFFGTEYAGVVALSAALVQHLAATERQLPRLVSYQLAANLPTLTVSNLLYGEGSRSDELIAENKIVHPAFSPRSIVALSE